MEQKLDAQQAAQLAALHTKLIRNPAAIKQLLVMREQEHVLRASEHKGKDNGDGRGAHV